MAAQPSRRIQRRIKESKLPELKLLADYDFAFQTGMDKRQIMDFAHLDFAELGSRLDIIFDLKLEVDILPDLVTFMGRNCLYY